LEIRTHPFAVAPPREDVVTDAATSPTREAFRVRGVGLVERGLALGADLVVNCVSEYGFSFDVITG
jgi:hypothetical protein